MAPGLTELKLQTPAEWRRKPPPAVRVDTIVSGPGLDGLFLPAIALALWGILSRCV